MESSTKSLNNLQHLLPHKILQNLNWDHRGILWIAAEAYSPQLNYFATLDYIFDGLLSRNFLLLKNNQQKNAHSEQLFCQNLFARPFFLIFVDGSSTLKESNSQENAVYYFEKTLGQLIGKSSLNLSNDPPTNAINSLKIMLLSEIPEERTTSYLPFLQKRLSSYNYSLNNIIS